MKVGKHIYYYHSVDGTYETIPAVIIKIGKVRLKIRADFPDGTREVWVSRKMCVAQ